MDRSELKKQIVGPIATVPTPFDDNFGVDYGKMRAAAEWWVEQGLVTGRAVVKVAAAMGEGPQLRDSEWPELLKTVVDATGGKASVVCGIHYKDTVRTIEDARRAQDLGAIGLQISPPIFNDPKQDDILRYYGAVSDAIGIGILIYNTPWQTYGNIEVATFEKMVDFEHVVAIKWHPSEPEGYEEIFKLADVFNIIDNNSTPVQCHKLGGKGFINLTAEVYPPFDMRIWDLMEQGDYETAQAEWNPGKHRALRVLRQAGRSLRRAGAHQEGAHGRHGPRFRAVPAPVAARKRRGDEGAEGHPPRVWVAGA